MEVELKAVAGAEVESYHVRMIETDRRGKHIVLGLCKRSGPNEWQFTPMSVIGKGGEEPVQFTETISLTLNAKDREELAGVIEQRFGAIDLPADRLRTATMERIADTMIASVQLLARRTNSLPGFSAAASRALARMIVEDLKPGHEAEYKAHFMQQVEAHVESLRAIGSIRTRIEAAMQNVFKAGDGAEDEEPTKH